MYIGAPVLIDLLRDYYKKVKPIKYLFNGIHKGKPYSPRSVQLTMAQSKKLAHINKKCSIHTLRNCYATHHLEGGTDLVFLQEQMGHKNLRTTIRYIGLCVERHRYIKHPIDSLQIRYQPKSGYSNTNSIGALFRDHGERVYPHLQTFDSTNKTHTRIRVCKTPALGGHVFICKDCGHKHFV
ncbi:MAG: tyrosine-type recombinase/integrase, partial [Saprospiraceae bacterium]|nr:tyrosine-type recombinase/integrase [Saprospiraceae bacterium]